MHVIRIDAPQQIYGFAKRFTRSIYAMNIAVITYIQAQDKYT